MNTIIRTSIVTIAVAVTVLVGTYMALQFNSFEPARAAAPFNVEGWAWSENTGWISMSGRNPDYGVTIDNNKVMSGYAWSSTATTIDGATTGIGWIKFGGLGCPSGGLDIDGRCAARIISDGGTGWEMTGWARACSVFAAGCAGALKSNDQRGGWDGWISLNCENTNTCSTSDYAIRIRQNGTVVSAADASGSFAWSGNNPDDGRSFMGWIDFGPTAIGDLCSADLSCDRCEANVEVKTGTDIWCTPVEERTTCEHGCNQTATTCGCNGAALEGTFTVEPKVIRRGQTVNISWDFPADVVCYIEGPSTNLITNTSNIATDEETGPITVNQATFTLICDGDDDVAEPQTVQVLPDAYES